MSKKSDKGKKVKIDGVDYIKKNGKLYGMPRTIANRKILRNRLRMILKQQGIPKVNKHLKHYWNDQSMRELLEKV